MMVDFGSSFILIFDHQMTHIVYKTEVGGCTYVGCTGLELCDREAKMKEKPGEWMKSTGPNNVRRIKLEPLLERRRNISDALALEAAFVASLYEENVWVRGGPYACLELSSAMKRELRDLAAALKGARRMSEQIAAVHSVASKHLATSALRRHLASKCFRCGGLWRNGCPCRSLLKISQRTGEPSRKRPSGRSLAGCEKRKRKYGRVRSSSEGFRRAKWGVDVAAGIQQNNENRTSPRTSGVKRRPASAGVRRRPASSRR